MPTLAKLTLQEIDTLMRHDSAVSFRQLLKKYLPLMDDAYRGKEKPFRNHLGVSMIGRKCARQLWYTFRWSTEPSFEPRILRLFNRGHLEEARFLAMLEMIGIQIWSGPEEGGQFRVKGYNGHFGSALDGIALGCPDLPNVPVLLEFKTANDKQFKGIVSKGVEESKWEHFVQMQVCMAAYKLTHSLYMVSNKNDDDLHAELVEADPGIAEKYNQRAAMVIDAKEPPMKINTDPAWFECRYCDHNKVCHYSEMPVRTCRSCSCFEPDTNGTSYCHFTGETIDKDIEFSSCGSYEFNEAFHFPV